MMVFEFFKRAKERANDAASEVTEPAQVVLNAVLIGGITAGIVLGGTYLYRRVKKTKPD